MKLLWRDQWKKSLQKPFYIISLTVIVFVIIVSFVAIQTTIQRLEAPIETFHETQNTEDFHILLGQIDFNLLTGAQRLNVCASFPPIVCHGLDENDPVQMNHITELIQNTIYNNPGLYDDIFGPMMDPFVENFGFEFEKVVSMNIEYDGHLFRFLSINERINIPLVHAGRLPETNTEIAIYERYAEQNGLYIGDTLKIMGRVFTITGFFYAPDHIMPLIRANHLNFNPDTQTLVLAQEAAIYGIRRPFSIKYQGKGDFTALYGTFEVTDIVTTDLRTFGRNMQMIRSVLPRDYNMRISTISIEAMSARVFSELFLGVFAALSLGLVALFMKRHVDEQQNDVKIISSLGYDNHQIAKGFMLSGMALSVVVALAFGSGLLLSHLFFENYAIRYQMPLADFTIGMETWIFGFIAPVIVLNLTVYLYGRYFLYRLNKPVRTTIFIMKLRQFKHAMGGFLLTMMVTILFLFAFFTRHIIDDFKTETMKGNHYENVVYLSRFTTTERDHVEAFSSGSVQITAHNGRVLQNPIRIQGYGLDEHITLKRLVDDDLDKNALLKEGFIISDQAAKVYGVGIGDTLSIRAGSVLVTQSVVAIHNDLIETSIYMTRETLNHLYGFPETYFNAYYTSASVVNDRQAIRILSYRAIAGEIETLFTLSNRITFYLMSLATMLALFMFLFITQSRLQAHLPTFLTLKALGYTATETYRLFFMKTLLALFVSFGFSVLVVYVMIEQVLTLLRVRLGITFVVRYAPSAVIISFVIVSVMVGIVTWIVHARANRINLSTVLKKA